MDAFGVAYSYIRFSTTEQKKGYSLRRQTDSAIRWCDRNNISLDTSLSFRDLGRSAYLGENRKNPDRDALASFLKLVETGRIRRGSYLIIESWIGSLTSTFAAV
jgi:DNA invertase Pin-like site-specific DNA recombinase